MFTGPATSDIVQLRIGLPKVNCLAVGCQMVSAVPLRHDRGIDLCRASQCWTTLWERKVAPDLKPMGPECIHCASEVSRIE